MDMHTEVVYDERPTARGFAWYCNACPYTTESHELGIEHVIQSKLLAFPHMLFERLTLRDPPKRRIALDASGIVQTIRMERKRT